MIKVDEFIGSARRNRDWCLGARRRYGALALSVVAGLFALPSNADTAGTNFTVQQIIIDDTNFSGCLANVTPGPETILSGCAAGFVTFDCRGDLGTSRSDSSLKLAAAQLAFVTDTQAFMLIDNSRTANGFCLAQRVDNQKTPAL